MVDNGYWVATGQNRTPAGTGVVRHLQYHWDPRGTAPTHTVSWDATMLCHCNMLAALKPFMEKWRLKP